MNAYARIAVNVPSLAGVFDYSVPESLAGQVGIGHLVVVPFGKQTVQGVVVRLLDRPSISETKEVIALIDPQPVLTQIQIALAESLAESTLSSLAAIVALFLPPGLAQQADVQYSVSNNQYSMGEAGEVQKRLLKLLSERGLLRGRQIDRHFKQIDWRKTARYLVKRGVLAAQSVLPPASVRPKFVRTAQLGVPPETAEKAMPHLGNTKATLARRQKALQHLIEHPEAINVSWVYAESGCNLADLQELAERGLISLRETEIWRDPLENSKLTDDRWARSEPVLTDEQQTAWNKIESGFRELAEGKSIKPFLLQGVTGSGKTELYIRATMEAIRRGRQAIVLVPEISLTPQIVQRFLARFPGQVGLIHSRLSEGERYDTWRRARLGLLKIIIGPRSALFAPLPNVGLIVLDECHDASYYQSEPPFYHAVGAAQMYARIAGAVCILGSATPSVTQRYQAERGGSVGLELTRRISSEPEGFAKSGDVATAPRRRFTLPEVKELDLPLVHVVDMREELKAGNRSILSRALHDSLENVLKRGEQAILFLNRRGTATYVFCRNCGNALKCPRCESPLTYHVSGGDKLLCHRCGYTRQLPKKCPECGSASMGAYGLGTEKVEADVQASFPKARTLRWDWETTRQKDAHEVILSHFAAGRADVLVGTQMLAKGLDLPRVTLVGIVLADVGLYLPDPFAAERAFQVLTQVAGRAGRSSRGGRVVLQTFAPDHYAIRAAATHDVNGFYEQELVQRRRLGYPPFSEFMRLEFRHFDARKAEEESTSLATKLRKQLATEDRRATTLIGPAPCFFSKLDGKYRWQIVLRGARLKSLLDGRLSPDWRVEVDPASLL